MVVDGEDDDDKDSDNDDDNDDDDYFALSISHCVTIMFCLSNSMVKPKMWLSISINRCRSFICSLVLNRSLFGQKVKKNLRYSSNKILTAKLSKAGSPKVCDQCIPEYFQLFHLLFCRRC